MDQISPRARKTPQYPEEVEALTTELLGHIADKWTMLVLEELGERETMRFGELRKAIPGVSQKMLTQTLRQMERVGLVKRSVFAQIPPRVEYERTPLGNSLGPAVCSLWHWVEVNAKAMQDAQVKFDNAQTS